MELNSPLDYCKHGIHQMQRISFAGIFQCADCGYYEHKCDELCSKNPHLCAKAKADARGRAKAEAGHPIEAEHPTE